jgi:hypothetical protein
MFKISLLLNFKNKTVRHITALDYLSSLFEVITLGCLLLECIQFPIHVYTCQRLFEIVVINTQR